MNSLSNSLQHFKSEIDMYIGDDEQYQQIQFLCNNFFNDLYFLSRSGLNINGWETLQKDSHFILQNSDYTTKINSIVDKTLELIKHQSSKRDIADQINFFMVSI